MSPVPDWMEAQVKTFDERVEMMILAFIHKHKQRPKLFTQDEKERGAMAAFVIAEPKFMEDGPVHPKLLELAEHGARAWDEWTKGADPAESVVTMIARPDEVRVRIDKRTPEFMAAFAEYVRRMQERMKKGS